MILSSLRDRIGLSEAKTTSKVQKSFHCYSKNKTKNEPRPRFRISEVFWLLFNCQSWTKPSNADWTQKVSKSKKVQNFEIMHACINFPPQWKERTGQSFWEQRLIRHQCPIFYQSMFPEPWALIVTQVAEISASKPRNLVQVPLGFRLFYLLLKNIC